MGRTPAWDVDAGFRDYVYAKDADGQPISLAEVARRYAPDHVKIEPFTRRVYQYAKRHDWRARREAIWLKHGDVAAEGIVIEDVPVVEQGDIATEDIDGVEVAGGQDGFCPHCGHEIVFNEGSLTELGIMAHGLQQRIVRQLEAATDTSGASELSQLSNALEKLQKMLERNKGLRDAILREREDESLSGGDLDEAKRVLRIGLELLAHCPPDDPQVVGLAQKYTEQALAAGVDFEELSKPPGGA
jgi:hypothetical protein